MTAILIDDEPNSVDLLALRLQQRCPDIKVVAKCTNSLKGIEAIKLLKPDILFLDIEMPQLNGFQVLEAVSDQQFALIFVTAYDKFAIKAFRYSAIDYLLKPIEIEELLQAIEKVKKNKTTSKQQIEYFKESVQNTERAINKIALPYQNGVSFVNISDIIFCESDDNYTKFILANQKISLVTKSLKEIQELLEDMGFLRVHRKFLVNLNHIKKYVKGDSYHIVMNNQTTIPVSRSQKNRLEEQFGWL